jgi:hypothetical protein
VQNRIIEIHDSFVESIAVVDGVAVLHFASVYMHSSEGRPGIDDGTVWTQEAILRIEGAQIDGVFPKESREAYDGFGHSLSGGSLRISGSVLENTIPMPLDVQDEVELSMECWGETVRVRGTSAKLEFVGTAKYVEEFHPNQN